MAFFENYRVTKQYLYNTWHNKEEFKASLLWTNRDSKLLILATKDKSYPVYWEWMY